MEKQSPPTKKSVKLPSGTLLASAERAGKMPEVVIRNPVIRQKATFTGDQEDVVEWLAKLIATWLPQGDRIELFLTPIDLQAIASNYSPPKDRATAPTPHAPTRHIRAWAKARGYEVGDRGALPPDIIRAYDRASRSSTSSTRAA